jgi:hypothetical protein
MNELEYEVRELFQGRVDGAERPVNLLPEVHRRARRTARQRVGAGALASVALIAAVVLPMLAGLSSGSPALEGGYQRAPRGWVPLDYGAAQFWVPPSWLVDGQGRCAGSKSGGVVYGGKLPGANCALPPNELTVVQVFSSPVYLDSPAPSASPTGITVTINGLDANVESAASGGLSVDVLGLHLTVRGAVAIRAVGTLTKSPLGNALSGSQQAELPPGFRWHEFGGIRFAAPATWATEHRYLWGYCSPAVDPGKVLLNSASDVPSMTCPYGVPDQASYFVAQQGLAVGAGPYAPGPSGQPCFKNTKGLRLYCIHPPEGFGTVYTLYLQPFGQKKATVMYIGIAGRGRIAKAIIDSIGPVPAH